MNTAGNAYYEAVEKTVLKNKKKLPGGVLKRCS